MIPHPILDQLTALLGPGGLRHGEAIEPRYLGDRMVQCGPEDGPLAVALPRDTAEVAAVLRLCHAHRLPVVAQGGVTGLTGAAVPAAGGLVLSLERLRRIIEVDAAGATMTVESGVPLQAIQEAADAVGMLFPLDLGARGSCLIGGNVSTNAGGNRVLRYGMTRDLVLGLEAVLADGTVVDVLNTLLKNNCGYDLKQLFIGAEGTLGVVTRVVLRLYPKPRSACTALCAVADYPAVMLLLGLARAHLAGTLSAFELMWPDFYGLAGPATGKPLPLPEGHGGYVLIEAMGSDQEPDQARFERMLELALDHGAIKDAVVAHSGEQAKGLWAVRDTSSAFRQTFWPHVVFDVGIPVGGIGDFVQACRDRLGRRWPGVRTVFFGHVADGNVHIGVSVPEDPMPAAEVEQMIYGAVREWRGAISAEHGIGLLKKEFLGHSRTPEAIALMRRIRVALDPHGILNPGKVFEPD